MSVNYSIRDNGSDMTGNDTGDDNGIFIHSPPVTVVLCILYSVVFVLAVIGNCLVIGVVYKNSCMHTVTNFLLVNLAVADILVSIFCLPTTLIMNILSSYPFGSFLCKVSPFLQGVVVSASVNTLAVIALDRYLAICWTLRLHISAKASKVIIICIWIGSAAIISPWLVFFKLSTYQDELGTYYACNESEWPGKRAYFLGVILLICYAIPLLMISMCYAMIGVKICRREVPGVQDSADVVHRSKLRVLKMLITVVLLFALCWLPLYVISGFVILGDSNPSPTLLNLVPFVQWLGLSSCCVNPLVYGCFSKKYRQGFKRTMTCSKTYSLENVSVSRAQPLKTRQPTSVVVNSKAEKSSLLKERYCLNGNELTNSDNGFSQSKKSLHL